MGANSSQEQSPNQSSPIAEEFKEQVETMRPKMPEQLKDLIQNLRKPLKDKKQ